MKPNYTGWVVSEQFGIESEQVRGNWEPAITQEEYDRGIGILHRHEDEKSSERNHHLFSIIVSLHKIEFRTP